MGRELMEERDFLELEQLVDELGLEHVKVYHQPAKGCAGISLYYRMDYSWEKELQVDVSRAENKNFKFEFIDFTRAGEPGINPSIFKVKQEKVCSGRLDIFFKKVLHMLNEDKYGLSTAISAALS